MKITDIKTIAVFAGWHNFVFVKVETDKGIVGWGEASLDGKDRSVIAAVEDCRDLILGWDPQDIEKIWRRLTRHSFWTGGPIQMSAVGGIDIALWDILGKSVGEPVWRLLGGKLRDRFPTYANAWYHGAKTPEEFAERARETVKRGFRAMKWDPFAGPDLTISPEIEAFALEQVKAVRDAVGPHVRLLIEAHARFDTFTAVRLAKRLEPYDIYFFEEPVPPENEDAMRRISELSPIQIVCGEQLYTRFDFRRLLEKHVVGIIQPDLIHVGGITEMKKIAAMAETYYVGVAPHLPNGPICAAATLQIDANIPAFAIQECFLPSVPWEHELVDFPMRLEDGCLLLPEGPGIGANLREDIAAEHPYQFVEIRLYSTDWVETAWRNE